MQRRLQKLKDIRKSMRSEVPTVQVPPPPDEKVTIKLQQVDSEDTVP